MTPSFPPTCSADLFIGERRRGHRRGKQAGGGQLYQSLHDSSPLSRGELVEFCGKGPKLGSGLREPGQCFGFAGGVEGAILIIVADRDFGPFQGGACARLNVGRFSGDAGLVIRPDHAARFGDHGSCGSFALGQSRTRQGGSRKRECRRNGGQSDTHRSTPMLVEPPVKHQTTTPRSMNYRLRSTEVIVETEKNRSKRSEEHTTDIQSQQRNPYTVF